MENRKLSAQATIVSGFINDHLLKAPTMFAFCVCRAPAGSIFGVGVSVESKNRRFAGRLFGNGDSVTSVIRLLISVSPFRHTVWQHLGQE